LTRNSGGGRDALRRRTGSKEDLGRLAWDNGLRVKKEDSGKRWLRKSSSGVEWRWGGGQRPVAGGGKAAGRRPSQLSIGKKKKSRRERKR